MRCPECDGATKVVDSGRPGARSFFGEADRGSEMTRLLGFSLCIVRGRLCKVCGYKFVTMEVMEEEMEAMLEE